MGTCAMGGGASKKAKKVETRYVAPPSGPSSSNDTVRPCEMCGEMRKLAQITQAGKTTKWLCTGCQFECGGSPVAKAKAAPARPEPKRPALRRGFTTDISGQGSKGLLD